ncbi:hypothetical protein Tco_1394028 [Tanacetum coccineum]
MTASTPMETQKPLLKDEDGEEVDVHMYRLMIGSLMYLTSSRPDIMFAVCVYARYQVNPKVSHLHAVKRIFRYLKGQPKLGLWYPKDSPFNLVAYTNSDYAGASLDRKFTTGDTYNMVAFLSKPEESDGFEQIVDFLNAHVIKYALTVNLTIYTLCIEQFWSIVKAKTINEEVQLHALVDGKKIIITESTVRRDLQLEYAEGVDSVYKELGDSLVRAATTSSSLEAEQDSGGGPRRQETMGDTIAQTRYENVSTQSYDPLLTRGNTLRSGEDSLKLTYMMDLCTNLQTRVLDLEQIKTTQQIEIDSLKRRVKKLKKKRSSRTYKLKRLYKVGFSGKVESSRDEESLDDADNEMFNVNTLTGDEVSAEQEVAAKDVNLTVNEVTLVQALAALKSVKPKVKGDVIEEPSVSVSVASALTKVSVATTITATIPTLL